MLTGLRHGVYARSVRVPAWLVLLAIFPALTFLGHWPALSVDIPGTDLFLGWPGQAHTHDDGAPESPDHDADGHARHCHSGVATCSDVPFTGASGFALLQEAMAAIGAAGVLTLLVVAVWGPARPRLPGPETPPPRARQLLFPIVSLS
jgi:hypothetical protein